MKELTKRFRNVEGKTINVVDHTLEVLNQHPNTQVYIGTDSQNLSGLTVYVTVIAYRYGNTGVHYIYNKEKVPRISTGNLANDTWNRLWAEAERTVEVAEWFKQKVNVPVEIDMDYNDDDYYDSNRLISAACGWASSLGYKVNVKPECLIACRAADYQCQ